MKNEKQLAKKPIEQSLTEKDKLKEAIQLVADITGDAKKAAAENPYTSSGKPKAELHGAAKSANAQKEEGIEAYKRGIVPKPNMEGGRQNHDLHTQASAALKTMEILERQAPNLPNKNNR